MAVKDVAKGAEVDERLAALLNNAEAIRAAQSAVEGTLGPRGLDVMLVDRFGGVTVTNDGVAILSLMEVNHPAARMLVSAARAQEEEVGDGTTTAAVMAGTIVSEAVNQVTRGVPLSRLLEGLVAGRAWADAALDAKARPVSGAEDLHLYQTALVAGRGHADVATCVVAAARLAGDDKLTEPGWKLADQVTARPGAPTEAFCGLLVEQDRVNRLGPREVNRAVVLCLDDALEVEELGDQALATEAGLLRRDRLREEFATNLARLVELGVNVIFTHRGLGEKAEEFLNERGIMAVPRVPFRRLEEVAAVTGARLLKRGSLARGTESLRECLGRAVSVRALPELKLVRVEAGAETRAAAVLVGAATTEVAEERERVAKDAAGAVQAAWCSGVVPGGGAVELAVARDLAARRGELPGMAAYGLDCLIAALKRPLGQIAANAGWSALEKVEEAWQAQEREGSDTLGVDCDTGALVDLFARGVVDPVAVKRHALGSALEVATAILRVNLIIRKRETPDHTEAVAREGSVRL